MTDIKNYETFIKIEPIDKGWSGDKKYYVETNDGRRLFLRISDISEYDRKKAEYEMMECVYNHDVLTSQPVDFGLCNGGKNVYSLSGWLEGEDVETVLPDMSEAEQYNLGVKAGEFLRKIHSIPAPTDTEDWSVRFNKRLQYWIDKYDVKADIHSETGNMAIRYLRENRDVLANRPQTFIHGDYNTENIIIMTGGEIGTIDFNGYTNTSYGDPWWDIENFAWMSVMFPHFYTGQVRGYFNGEPPIEFWNVLTYYLAYDTLTASTDPQGLNDIEDGTKIVQNILNWTNNFQTSVPAWYLKDFYVEWIAGVPITLKKPFDLSFIYQYGTVFSVVNNWNIWSGNICLGVENDGQKYFLKFAGAPKAKFDSATAEQSIGFLKDAAQVYRDLAHENLIKFVRSEEAGGGYVNVFEWADGECIGYPSPPSRQKFLNLPIEAKMQAFDDILDFHAHVAERGYVAIDFYADQIMYDFESGKTIICDIDFYQKAPYYGDKGTWGSSNFVSPEELVPGSRIDEVTMVYTMGATAFSIFSDYDRSPEAWTLDKNLYDVVKKSVSDERDMRQQSIGQLIKEWNEAK